MVNKLIIHNFALIEKLELDFGMGLNILSGETGAGKSIVIGAIGLLLGGRASSDSIRAGAKKSTITGLFSINKQLETDVNEFYGIEVEDGQLIIEREIYQQGKSLVRVNGKLITVGMLKSLTAKIVDLHGQHQHHTLLDPSKHIEILDLFGDSRFASDQNSYQHYYRLRKKVKKDLNQLYSNIDNRDRQIDLYNYEINEIETSNLYIGEDDQLEKDRDKLHNAQKLLDGAQDAYNEIYSGVNSTPITETLGKVVDNLKTLSEKDKSLLSMAEVIEDSLFNLEDAARELLDYSEGLDMEPQSLTKVEDRIEEINRLKRKYGNSIEDILKYKESKEKELKALIDSEEIFNKLSIELDKIEKKLFEIGTKITKKRKVIAKKIASEVKKNLQDMDMKNIEFIVDFNCKVGDADYIEKDGETIYLHEKGFDAVEFLISPNPGEPLKPLAKIASGGEMSRIMLAIKNILADKEKISTLIFDEVDTGVGGRTAQKVAEKLYSLSINRQVICVSHLPQVCAMADTHFKIEKNQQKGRTYTDIFKLDDTKKIKEIARMISGTEMTQGTINNAREILSLADCFKRQYS
ncbi:DNA repair protein RecN [Proteinivorax tanatarense]|uniref:DNA repair protein RecN n=1 Tax=Proteinivorax tanatarense TaxID=1260629 RepID=A0AAU7VPC1_9FIRM